MSKKLFAVKCNIGFLHSCIEAFKLNKRLVLYIFPFRKTSAYRNTKLLINPKACYLNCFYFSIVYHAVRFRSNELFRNCRVENR